jgi:hypothetical protein
MCGAQVPERAATCGGQRTRHIGSKILDGQLGWRERTEIRDHRPVYRLISGADPQAKSLTVGLSPHSAR